MIAIEHIHRAWVRISEVVKRVSFGFAGHEDWANPYGKDGGQMGEERRGRGVAREVVGTL